MTEKEKRGEKKKEEGKDVNREDGVRRKKKDGTLL